MNQQRRKNHTTENKIECACEVEEKIEKKPRRRRNGRRGSENVKHEMIVKRNGSDDKKKQ